jgi:hypothetical protein
MFLANCRFSVVWECVDSFLLCVISDRLLYEATEIIVIPAHAQYIVQRIFRIT